MAKIKKIETKDPKEDIINIENIKEQLKIYIDEEIKREYKDELNKYNNKLIREKNKKIIFRNIIILLLLAVIGLLLYLLYDNNYFAKILVKDNDTNLVIKDENIEKDNNKETVTSSLNELKVKYGKLIDRYYISDTSIYKDDYYNAKLTKELKSYMTLNNIDFKNLEIDDNSNIISELEFSETYNSLFNDKYEGINFDYHNNKIRYLNKMSSYITEKILVKDVNNIVREIIDINEKDNQIIITCIEGKVVNNDLYNIINDTKVGLYNGELLKYQDKLNIIKYIFENNKLVNLSK